MIGKAEKIQSEIEESEVHLEALKNRLAKLQEECPHQYEGNSYYQRCVHCGNVEVLYY